MAVAVAGLCLVLGWLLLVLLVVVAVVAAGARLLRVRGRRDSRRADVGVLVIAPHTQAHGRESEQDWTIRAADD